MSQDNKPTVAIIGAGPAGCSCAIVLLQSGKFNVSLINAPQKERFQIGESIPPDMNPLLRELGVFAEFKRQQHDPCFGSCSYWGSQLRGYNDTILSPHGHAWHLDRRKFNELLFSAAQALGAGTLQDHSFVDSQHSGGQQQLLLKSVDGSQIKITCDFVIDASGNRAVVARSQGSVKQQETALICLGLRFAGKSAAKLATLTHLESVEYGWWYGARIPKQQVLVTLYTNAATVKQLDLQKTSNWLALLQESPQTSRWIQHLEALDQSLMAFPAPSFCLDKIYGAQFLAIGDAASCYDPITANGIIKAVTHGMRAAQSLVQWQAGSRHSLQRFAAEIQHDHQQYRQMRSQFYQMEQRWAHSIFWREMHALT